MSDSNKKFKILMMDDDMFFRKIYRDQLMKAGFDFSEAINGIEGMHKVETEKPDLILLDLMLPRKNGFEVLKEIRKKDETKKIPVIILSNLGQEADIKEGMSLGADSYLVKGETKLSEVIEIINKALAKK
ncbi:response regulator [Patescibacteria group bacterium]|nr:response regulator [Patescibacteria group bacterium]